MCQLKTKDTKNNTTSDMLGECSPGIRQLLFLLIHFPGGSDDKVSAYNAGDLGSISRSGGSPGEGNATHSSILAWKIP